MFFVSGVDDLNTISLEYVVFCQTLISSLNAPLHSSHRTCFKRFGCSLATGDTNVHYISQLYIPLGLVVHSNETVSSGTNVTMVVLFSNRSARRLQEMFYSVLIGAPFAIGLGVGKIYRPTNYKYLISWTTGNK